MRQFEFIGNNIEGVFEVYPFLADDERGFFSKAFEKNIFLEHGIDFCVQESIVSYSKKNVLRGMHFQENEPQAKLINVLQGEIFDVAVDLRKDSKTFGKWFGAFLNSDNKKMLYIPRNFAHGYLVLSEEAYVTYQCDNKYYKQYDSGIIWDDKDIGIKWPIENVNNLIISDKDRSMQSFKEWNR